MSMLVAILLWDCALPNKFSGYATDGDSDDEEFNDSALLITALAMAPVLRQ